MTSPERSRQCALEGCEQWFQVTKPNRRFCSTDCQQEVHRRKREAARELLERRERLRQRRERAAAKPRAPRCQLNAAATIAVRAVADRFDCESPSDAVLMLVRVLEGLHGRLGCRDMAQADPS